MASWGSRPTPRSPARSGGTRTRPRDGSRTSTAQPDRFRPHRGPRVALWISARELALALAPVHEAGVSHGHLRPDTVGIRPDGGPLVHAPYGAAGAADDLNGLGILLLSLLTGRNPAPGLVVAGEAGPAAEAAALLQGLLAPDPAARPGSAREVAARLGEIASAVPDTTLEQEPRPRRRARLATAIVLLVVAGAAGGYLVGHRVGPAGPALSPTTVTVPPAPAASP